MGVVVEVAVDVAIAAGLAVLGVGVAGTVSNQDYSTMLEKIKNQQVMQTVAGVTATMVAGHAVYNLTKDFLTALGNSFKTLYDTFSIPPDIPDNVTIPMSGKGLSMNQICAGLGFNVNLPSNSPFVSYSISQIFTSVDQYMPFTSFSGKAYKAYYDSGSGFLKVYTSSGSTIGAVQWYPNSGVVGYLLNYLYYDSGKYYEDTELIRPYNGGLYEFGLEQVVTGSDATLPEGIGEDVIQSNWKSIFADGVSILNNPVSDVVGRVGDTVGTKNDAGEVVGVPANVKDGADTSIDKTRDVSQESVLGKDISTDADRDKDNTTNKDKDTTPPKAGDIPDLSLPEVIFKEKFPFCLPWDIYTAFSNLVAPAQPPKWQVPFKIKSLSYSQDVSIDFSQFNMLASILRWGLSIAFVIWLILLTRRIIGQ